MGLFSFLFGGCNKQPAAQSQGVPPQQAAQLDPSTPLTAPPEVTSEAEEGFHDLVFYIQAHETLSDGSQRLRAAGLHQGRPLEIDVVLGAGWKSGKLGGGLPIESHRGWISYRSVGPASDAFLQMLDVSYNTHLNPKAMRAETKFIAISLQGNPGDLAKGPVKIKLFYETDSEDSYAELYTNIDLAACRLEIREKDEEYRRNVIQALAAE